LSFHARRIDANQNEIVKTLRQIPGVSVAITSALGNGFPDLVVGFRGRNFLLEIKDGQKKPSQQQLTPEEAAWHLQWRGKVSVVKNIDEAIRALDI
jgi:hypothetical protein